MADLVFTHPDKIMYPQAGITKGEILDYYRQIAPRLLPWLHDRPATLERFPNGIGNDGHAPHFWQKNLSASAPEWITRASLPTEQGETVHYALVNDLQTLLYFVNQGTLTFHVWLSPMPHLDQPDFVLFDLDPGPVGFAGAVVVAQALHAILQAAGRDAVVKTSGKAGLHMLVPWMKGDYDQARAWAEETADQLVHTMPDQATTERSKAKRGRRVYVDVMQNVKGHHVVPPYVLRPTPMATVSTPLTWKELKPTLDPRRFNLKTIFRRLARQRRDPMADLLSVVSGATQG